MWHVWRSKINDSLLLRQIDSPNPNRSNREWERERSREQKNLRNKWSLKCNCTPLNTPLALPNEINFTWNLILPSRQESVLALLVYDDMGQHMLSYRRLVIGEKERERVRESMDSIPVKPLPATLNRSNHYKVQQCHTNGMHSQTYVRVIMSLFYSIIMNNEDNTAITPHSFCIAACMRLRSCALAAAIPST